MSSPDGAVSWTSELAEPIPISKSTDYACGVAVRLPASRQASTRSPVLDPGPCVDRARTSAQVAALPDGPLQAKRSAPSPCASDRQRTDLHRRPTAGLSADVPGTCPHRDGRAGRALWSGGTAQLGCPRHPMRGEPRRRDRRTRLSWSSGLAHVPVPVSVPWRRAPEIFCRHAMVSPSFGTSWNAPKA